MVFSSHYYFKIRFDAEHLPDLESRTAGTIGGKSKEPHSKFPLANSITMYPIQFQRWFSKMS